MKIDLEWLEKNEACIPGIDWYRNNSETDPVKLSEKLLIEQEYAWYCWLIGKFPKKLFRKCWNPDKFEWKYSDLLTMDCPKYFKIWWNPDKFNWYFCEFLTECCPKFKYIWAKELKT